ncbi:hypothetical protein B0H10DRAFT_2195761 [Mycena sp. CBHHK59/15]|nr:hypothetical protein B0H10DRAFT_2195761 [Mycena sp. CBHHK59/15]
MLDDPDQPIPAARPSAREDMRTGTPEFDPADREPSPPVVHVPIPSAEQEENDTEAARVDLAHYGVTPGPHTVVTYPGVNLPACGIVIDKKYHLFMTAVGWGPLCSSFPQQLANNFKLRESVASALEIFRRVFAQKSERLQLYGRHVPWAALSPIPP